MVRCDVRFGRAFLIGKRPSAGIAKPIVVGFAVIASYLSLQPIALAQTTATYVGSGTNPASAGNPAISAKAVFSIIQTGTSGSDTINTLRIVLYNTNTATSLTRGEVLSTVLFNFSSGGFANFAQPANTTAGFAATVSLVTPVAGSVKSQVIDSGTFTASSSQAVNGSFVYKDQPTAGNAYTYGVGSSGFGTAGATNGTYAFPQKKFTLGSGDDYSLVGYNATSMGGSSAPMIQNAVQIDIPGFTDLRSTSQITGVGFGFGSGSQPVGANQVYQILTGTPQSSNIPEPGAGQLAILSLLMVCTVLGIKRAGKNRE